MDEILNSPESLELGGINRKLTIMASDIRGFTKLSEVLTPQEMVAMLNDYFSVMTEIVNMNHGTVDKFIGDAIMVLFGAPLATENDVFNSVRTALEMQDAIKIFEEKWREVRGDNWSFNIGIGINTGDVVVGNIGSASRMEYTAIGDNVNVAFRLESIAPGGTVLITESVYNEIGDKIVVEKMQAVTVKGREQPVQVYKLLGLK
jgi:class 3 adenylate cyclase